MKKTAWIFIVFFALTIGIYPITYLLFDMSRGLWATKPPELLNNGIWKSSFYIHILFGGIALLIGWTQFLKRFRSKYLNAHRTIGKVYLGSIFLSGLSGLFIAWYASGGVVAVTGFAGLAIGWLITTLMAYVAIRNKDLDEHQHWMIRSYALCFAAVTLRIWLPLFQFGFGMDFFVAYRIIAWFCWVPNLFVAEVIIRNLKTANLSRSTV